MNRTRERGVIVAIDERVEHGLHTATVLVMFNGSAHQNFGGLDFGKGENGNRLRKLWLRQLSLAFGVDTTDELINRECFALREMPTWNEPIVGLESVDTGRRFLTSRFRQTHLNDVPFETPLEARKRHIRAEIRSLEARIETARERLASVESEFIDWSEQ